MHADNAVQHDYTVARGYTVRIARGNRTDSVRYTEFSYIPQSQLTTIIIMLEWLRAHEDPSLLFRRSCYHGSCGTCGVMVNSSPRLACTCKLSEYPVGTILTLDSLPALSTYGDIASNPEALYGAFPLNARYLRSAEGKKHPLSRASRNATARTENMVQTQPPVQMERCIECSLCQSSCPVPNFMGPAVLSAYYREGVNVPHRKPELFARIKQKDGATACQSHYHCSNACPAGVYPSADIKSLQKQISS